SFGVDLFFVLSGFIMCLTVRLNLDDGPENASYFIKKRIVRIFPIYILCTVPLLLFNIKAEGVKDAYFYIGYLLLLPSITSDSTYRLVLSPGWSLTYEMLFYSLFAFLILFTRDKNRLLKANIVFLISLVVIVRMLSIQGPQLGWVNLRYIIGDTLLWNFGLGVVVYWLYMKYKNRFKINLGYSLTLLIAISVISVFLYGYFIILRILAFGLPAFIIVALFTLTKNHSGNRKIIKKMVFIGDASYSIYLVHYYFVFFKPRVLLLEGFLNINPYVFLNIVDIVLVIGSVVAGCVFYLHIEKPIIKYFSQKTRRQLSPAVEQI